MKEFVVIWNNTEYKFVDYDEAVDYAKFKTRHEDEHFTALIIMRQKLDNGDVKIPVIQGCSWVMANIFELVNLNM